MSELVFLINTRLHGGTRERSRSDALNHPVLKILI